MNTRRINGFILEKMLRNGLANLRSMEETLNAMNVFPVADGDTGSNLCLTLHNGLRYARSNEHVGMYLHGLNEGLLLGARGNSGVILSQLFRGVYQHLARCAAANCGDIRNALIRGYKTAYQAVIHPVEGTVLTVAREGIENIRHQIGRSTTMEMLFSMYIAELKKSLARTPQLLPQLAGSGVVDSGALGYILLVEGMAMYLNGRVLQAGEAPLREARTAAAGVPLSAFHENSTFEEGYCMEFILQLMKSPDYLQSFVLENFINEIASLGSSLVATQDQSRVKVHIHTKKPAWLITICQRYGEFLTFKLENMQLQHNEQDARSSVVRAKHAKSLGLIAVAKGEGLAELFKGLGCDCVLRADAGMVADNQFQRAFDTVDAEAIVVLPNSEPLYQAAVQAVGDSKRENIIVLPAKSVPEGYFAASMDVGDSPDTTERLENMKLGLEGVCTLTVEKSEPASRDYAAVLDRRRVCSGASPVQTLVEGLGAVEGLEEKETCIIFRGFASEPELEDALAEALEAAYPWLELEFYEGGQADSLWICGIS